MTIANTSQFESCNGEGAAREAALSDVRAALVDHTQDGHVVLGGGVWIITASTPAD